MAREIAEKEGDFGPLKQAIKHMKLRHETGGSGQETYTEALNRLTSTKLWRECSNLINN